MMKKITDMKSIKQKEQIKGYKHSTIINEILSKYRIKLQDLSIKELKGVVRVAKEWENEYINDRREQD